MATRIPIPHEINNKKTDEFPTKTIKSVPRKRKSVNKDYSHTTKVISKSEEKQIINLKVSLRDECLRLASFLKQESHRPGLIR